MKYLFLVLWGLFVIGVALVAVRDVFAVKEQTPADDVFGGHYKILNFDKLIVGTDKMIYMQPPRGKYWLVLQGSTELEKPVEGATFVLWLETAPYAAYRNPVTGQWNEGACTRCVTLTRLSASTGTLFPFRGTISNYIFVNYPNRLMAVLTPVHGGFTEPVQTWTRIAVLEYDLKTPVIEPLPDIN